MLKKNQAMKLILLAGALSFPVTGMAEQMPNQPRTSISQQNGKVTGTVEDALGTVIGATVVVKGTTNGTTTDIDGRFTLEGVKKGSILQISFVGYTTKEVKYTGQSVLKIMLQEDTKTLDEVVVVGFGTQKKVNLTGSVGTVDSEALASRPVQNAVQALQGVVPGLQITTTSGALDNKMSMSIRGTGTIGDGSDASPLVLIDGMEGDINSINPQDIENISILKDAAAASIYGSRAPFGVILVTTKSGKSGKTTINYNNNFRWGQPVRIPKQMDSYTFATFYNDANINSGAGAYFNAEHLQRIKDYQDGKITDGVLADANNKYWLDGYAGGNANTDWYDVIYREWTSSQEHAIMYHCKDSLSGINGQIRPGIVHRIDMDTTGSLIVCKNDESHVNIAEQIKEHTVNRIYVGIVCGNVTEDEGTIEGAIGRHPVDRKKMAVNEKNGKPAITHYKVLERFGNYTYMQFQLETGNQ